MNGGIAVFGTAVGLGGGWMLMPRQEVRSDKAVRDAQEQEAAGKPPVTATAAYRPKVDDVLGWAFAQPLSREREKALLANTDPDGPGEWATAAGGVHLSAMDLPGFAGAGFTRLRITLRGQHLRTVQVTEIRAKVHRSSPPPAGALIFRGAQGGGPLIEVGFELDAPNPVARIPSADGGLGVPYLDQNSLTLEPQEVVSLDVTARSRRHLHEWTIEMTLLVDQEERNLRIDSGSGPFRTSAFAERYDTRYVFSPESPAGWRSLGPGRHP
ncbi:hypothetical protein ACQSSU_15400 [Micromonospora echinospora]